MKTVKMTRAPAQRAAEKVIEELFAPAQAGETPDLVRDVAAIIEAEYSRWQPMATAPRDGTPVLLLMKGVEELPPHRNHVAGIQFAGRTRAEWGADYGWVFAAPVGYGGFPDEWLVGWMPLPGDKAAQEAQRYFRENK